MNAASIELMMAGSVTMRETATQLSLPLGCLPINGRWAAAVGRLLAR